MLVITALLVTLLLLSTALYISETEKTIPSHSAGANDALQVYRLGTTHAIISALANISNGGNDDILADDLNLFKSVLVNHSYDAILKLDYSQLSVAPYQDGVWISWGQDGVGVSSACVDFVLNCSGLSSTLFSEYSVNITSTINVNGNYATVNGSLKAANVTFTLLNEGKPALARNFTVFYEDDGSLSTEEWITAQSPSVTDYGNGTYLISFTAETLSPGDPLIVSVHCQDSRSILVQANVTCSQN